MDRTLAAGWSIQVRTLNATLALVASLAVTLPLTLAGRRITVQQHAVEWTDDDDDRR